MRSFAKYEKGVSAAVDRLYAVLCEGEEETYVKAVINVCREQKGNHDGYYGNPER